MPIPVEHEFIFTILKLCKYQEFRTFLYYKCKNLLFLDSFCIINAKTS